MDAMFFAELGDHVVVVLSARNSNALHIDPSGNW
jgi:hypothetical protein